VEKTYVRGVGMTPFHGKGRTIKQLAGEALNEALEDAGFELDDLEAVFFANSLAGVIEGQECIRGETVMYSLGAGNIPVANVENACASAGTALHLARSAVAAGQYGTVLAIGVERMRFKEKTRTFNALAGATDVEQLDAAPDAVERDRSPFIDVYAARARMLISERGVTVNGLARIATKAWANGALNPKAQRRTPTTPEAILESRVVVEPLTVDMCALLADGAAAAIVSSRRESNRDVEILASQLRMVSSRPGELSSAEAASRAAYAEACLEPADMNLAEVHDATAPGEMLSWTGCLLCAAGDEEKWAQSGHTERDGPMPVNPSGGLIARGHPIGASGLAQSYEIVSQLRGEAGDRQLPNARIGLAHVGGGLLERMQTAVATVHIFAGG
jgi:acetyl-CoA acetyltransferase